MFIEQIYTGCLAQASYYIESNGEAAVIDPIRESEPYLLLAEKRGAKIKYVFETHFHADFVSGHVDLADKSGAIIVFGPKAKPGYPSYIANHNELFNIGHCKIKVLHTPGHTIESSCFLIKDENEKEVAVFTGDTLFVGDVGRPDLMSGNLKKEELASMLYDSLHQVISKLADDVIVYPGHGAGSACGKNLGKERFSTIGDQKKFNYALLPQSRDQFINSVVSGLSKPPAYFFKDASINIIGARSLDDVIKSNCRLLSLENFNKEMENGALIIDTRDAATFAKGFIPGSINIGLKGEFAPWVGLLIDMDADLLFIADNGKETEVVTRLARIGYENVKGTLEGGFETWQKNNLFINEVESVDAYDFNFLYNSQDYKTIDLRRPVEVAKANINRAYSIPLEELQERLNELDKHTKYLLFCVGGYRSMIAASILKKNGFSGIINLTGGINELKSSLPEMVHVS